MKEWTPPPGGYLVFKPIVLDELDIGEESNMTMKFWRLVLGGWLILTALIVIAGLSFGGLGMVMAIIALIAGILVIIDR